MPPSQVSVLQRTEPRISFSSSAPMVVDGLWCYCRRERPPGHLAAESGQLQTDTQQGPPAARAIRVVFGCASVTPRAARYLLPADPNDLRAGSTSRSITSTAMGVVVVLRFDSCNRRLAPTTIVHNPLTG